MTSRFLVLSAVVMAAALPLRVSQAHDANLQSDTCTTEVVTSDISKCLYHALRASDDRLNETYQLTMRALAPQDQQKLAHAERLWMSYRDASCLAERDLYVFGTAGPPAELACRNAETQARAAELKRAYGWRVEKFGK